MNRRTFLEYTKLAMGLPLSINGYGASTLISESPIFKALVGAADASDKILIIIQLSGGNDGLNTVIPLDQMSLYTSLRKNVAIKEAKALPIGNLTTMGLHPAMNGFQRLYSEGKLAIVQGASYPKPNFSHFEASDIWMTAVDSGKTSSSGWSARHLVDVYPNFPTGYPNADMPDPVAIQIGSVVSTSLVNNGTPVALVLQNPDTFAQLVGSGSGGIVKNPLNNAAGRHVDYIQQIQANSVVYAKQIKAAAGKASNQVTYPTNNSLADQLKIVARMIGGGLKTKVYQVSLGGFDTHAGQTWGNDTSQGTHANLLKKLSDAVTVFLDDLAALNVADRVVGMTFSEFGRRVASNASGGTDHGSASPMFVFGAGIKKQMIGRSDNLSDLDNGNLKMQNDFREVYAALLEDWFGISNSPTLLYKSFTPTPIFRTTANARRVAPQAEEITTRLYPNPVSDFLIVESTALENEIKQVSLYDLSGREQNIEVRRIADYQIEIDVMQVPSGRYILRIVAGESNIAEQVVVFK